MNQDIIVPGDTPPTEHTLTQSVTPKTQVPPDWNYEKTVAKVEAIIEQIESGELELAEVFDQFAIAAKQLSHCETFLTQQQQRMDVLIETLLDEPAS
ncbi:MAG: exodeoxyribonuclease VII small subunit [Cyanothece sp. SIO1E1]|nr:exodeoxyribonuclease VII small subunit [Cyanothece sp. SIO1E1]